MEKRKRESSGGEGLSDMTRQIERLQRDLVRRERELEEERRETERTMDRMRVLERDKIDLKRELDEVRDEVTEYQRLVDELQQEQPKGKGKRKAEDEDERLNSLRTTVQERNREIANFIQDLEKMEEEKENLKGKLNEVTHSLEEATVQLRELATDRMELKTKLAKTEELAGRLEEEKAVLEIRERELLEFKERHDQHLENLGNAVDIRVEVWKKMIFQKDEEIERLNHKVNSLLKQVPNAQSESDKGAIHHLKTKLNEAENQIRMLSQELQNATKELNYNTNLIQSLQAQAPYHGGGSGEEFDRIVRNYEKRIRKLENKIEKRNMAISISEKEAEEKSHELVHLSARLREYEAGHYGLSEAVSEIKDLNSQIRIRDRDLEKLTQDINQFQMEGSELLEENELLRKKLGYTIHDDLTKERRHFTKKREEELITLRTKLEVMENEITTLKTRNYELKKIVNTATGTSQEQHRHIDQSPLNEISIGEVVYDNSSDQWREKYDIILHENTELRKGLQEILDSIQRLSEDGACSNVKIESPILENLLREMSARGLINYPYAISSFHLKVCNLEGKNSQLRDELQRTRIWAEGLIDKEKQKCEEWREKAVTAQEMLKHNGLGKASPEVGDKLRESQQETSRWRRIAEQSEKLIAMLNEKAEESETKIQDLESRLEKTKDNTFGAVHRTPSLLEVPSSRTDGNIQSESIGVQTDIQSEGSTGKELGLTQGIDLESQLKELEKLLAAKDEVIENLQKLAPSYEFKPIRMRSPISNPEMEESLQVARESITSLTERLRAKDDNLAAYKRLLAEVRNEMQISTERHVQDINALQSTIHQQQQAFTRMKSTLSHPVRDSQTSDIGGIIREQLTRINELEECVRDLEHTMSNVASQLAAARSDAHRWKATADARLKEIDILREQLGSESKDEIEILRQKLKNQDDTFAESKRLNQNLSTLKEILQEKDREIQTLRTSASVQIHSQTHKSFASSNKGVDTTKGEIDRLRAHNIELQSKLSKVQVRLSKINATNKASGVLNEIEDLKNKFKEAIEERDVFRNRVQQIESTQLEEDERKRKTIEGFARWDEGKKWKKQVEKLEEQKREAEEERLKLQKQMETIRNLVMKLEKEKSLLETRLKKGMGLKSSMSEQSLYDDGSSSALKMRQEIDKLRKALDEKELHSKDEVERLIMEIRILRERIQAQERQLTAYEVAQKGDPKIVSEIEKLVQNNERLQQDLVKLEQENLDFKLQIQEMKLETPRLRDRVQHLQKMVDVLKSDRSENQRGGSGKSLIELEKTVTSLKAIIEKLQKENKKSGPKNSKTSLRERQEGIIEDKQRLLDQIHQLEIDMEKSEHSRLDLEIRIGEILRQREDAQNRAQSAEMKLKTFLEQENVQTYTSRIKSLEEELERKSHLLNDAKQALYEIENQQSKKSKVGFKKPKN